MNSHDTYTVKNTYNLTEYIIYTVLTETNG